MTDLLDQVVINTDQAPKPIGHYVQALFRQGVLYASGQIGVTTAGQLCEGIDAQVDQVCQNLLAVAKQVNMGSKNLVKTTVFLVDLSDVVAVNKYFEKYQLLAARSTIQVSALPKAALVEIEAVFT